MKGDGEIVEEIVSRERQKAINKVHTMDGSDLMFIIAYYFNTHTASYSWRWVILHDWTEENFLAEKSNPC